MRLAKPHIDVGLYSNQREAQLAFWQHDVGLAFNHMAKLGGGVQQHRHDLLGSVLKMNHAREPLEAGTATGLRELIISQSGLTRPKLLKDPDGNSVRLVPAGQDGITGIAVRIDVSDLTTARAFYGGALELPEAPGNGFRCGDSLLLLNHNPAAEPVGDMRALGFRYMTMQIHDVEAAHRAILSRGGTEGAPPRHYGDTAYISFVRDPDGNWIEISQRAELTGPLDDPVASSERR
jgi:lactoylglutathione lyase